ncbi:hypothetical protein BH23GEM6_BH23GEM6_18620 [soil metagenome]
MLEIQSLPRSINEILILSAVQKAPAHGYQIALEIEDQSGGYFSFKHGTLYPILHKLEKEGLIDGRWDEGRGPRKRKQYVVTDGGRLYLRQRVQLWRELQDHLSAFLVESTSVCARAASDQR